MKLNLNKPLIELDGTPQAETLAKPLALMLKMSGEPRLGVNFADPIKAWEWAQELYKTGEINLDTSDYEALRGFVERCPQWAMVRAQILMEMREQREGQKVR